MKLALQVHRRTWRVTRITSAALLIGCSTLRGGSADTAERALPGRLSDAGLLAAAKDRAQRTDMQM